MMWVNYVSFGFPIINMTISFGWFFSKAESAFKYIVVFNLLWIGLWSLLLIPAGKAWWVLIIMSPTHAACLSMFNIMDNAFPDFNIQPIKISNLAIFLIQLGVGLIWLTVNLIVDYKRVNSYKNPDNTA